jgi:hypothetical protein
MGGDQFARTQGFSVLRTLLGPQLGEISRIGFRKPHQDFPEQWSFERDRPSGSDLIGGLADKRISLRVGSSEHCLLSNPGVHSTGSVDTGNPPTILGVNKKI